VIPAPSQSGTKKKSDAPIPPTPSKQSNYQAPSVSWNPFSMVTGLATKLVASLRGLREFSLNTAFCGLICLGLIEDRCMALFLFVINKKLDTVTFSVELRDEVMTSLFGDEWRSVSPGMYMDENTRK
jgi:hypothetical protein